MELNSNISYIIPAFNCAETITDTIDSIYLGNYLPGDEIVVVNDASTDDTYSILLKLQKKYPSIKVLNHKYNKGSAAAGRNTAIENAHNEILFCLDADNILIENSIGKLKKYMIESKANTASFQEIHFFVNKGHVTHKRIYPHGVIKLNDALAGHLWPGPSGNYMLTKSNWLESGRYHEFVGGAIDSWAFGIKQLLAGSKMVVMPDSHYLHRYGYESTYIRDEKQGNVSLKALQILLPFLDMIDAKDVKYLLSKKGLTTWFQNLDKHPIKLKNQKAYSAASLQVNKKIDGNKLFQRFKRYWDFK